MKRNFAQQAVMSLFIIVLAIVFLAMAKPAAKQRIFMIGDSTMANKTEKGYPETGWGQVFSTFFNSSVVVDNHAQNGRSSKSFIDEGRWEVVLNQLQKGDLVFIQFGHNDQKDKSPTRFTNPYTQYRFNLKRYVNETRAKGAIPVLFTSIVRRNFNDEGVLIDTHGAYTEVVRSVAAELQVPFVDMQLLTEQLVVGLGVEGSKAIYLHVEPGHENYPDGKIDNTHLNREGALRLAELAADELCKQFSQLERRRINKK
jgi:lysophospholipase L1-like esterase